MFRVGIVQAQDVPGVRVRVQFTDRDQMVSGWLPIVQPATQNDKVFAIPDLGEQVVVHMDSQDEDGAVLGSVYSSVDTPPGGMTADKRHISFKDGAFIEYDRNLHAFKMTLPSGATMAITAGNTTIQIQADGKVHINAPDITFQTSEHVTTLNEFLDWADAHIHNFTDSHGDTGPTGPPTTQVPTS